MNMKILLSAAGSTLDSSIDPRFGRGAYLLVLDLETGKWEAHPNPGVNAAGGAGIQAAQFATQQKAQVVISGDFGPNAFEALQAAGIDMYLYGDCSTINQAVEHFKTGLLQKVSAPTGRGHRG